MNTGELIQKLAKNTKMPTAQIKKVLAETFTVIQGEVKKGRSVRVSSFGTFLKAKRKARNGRNPHTGDKIQIKAKSVAKFRPSLTFKKALN